jgi:hypothetical protein
VVGVHGRRRKAKGHGGGHEDNDAQGKPARAISRRRDHCESSRILVISRAHLGRCVHRGYWVTGGAQSAPLVGD